jgi:tRNA 2-thiouridine synthesizing protein A
MRRSWRAQADRGRDFDGRPRLARRSAGGCDDSRVESVVVIEGGDLGCARLLVLLRQRVAELDEGTVVHLSTSDPVAPIDLPVWCRMTGHEYLGTVDGPEVPTYAVRVSATPTATDPANPWRRLA